MEWLVPLLCALLGGGGLWALLAARATGKATEAAAVSAAEATKAAAEAAAAPALAAASSADWSSLMAYWQQEMKSMRADANRLEVRVLFLERQREEDLQHISDLEAHIWAELPPPPPPRRRTPPPMAP